MCIPVAKGQTGDPSCLWANRVSVANVVAGLALSVPRYTLLSMDVRDGCGFCPLCRDRDRSR